MDRLTGPEKRVRSPYDPIRRWRNDMFVKDMFEKGDFYYFPVGDAVFLFRVACKGSGGVYFDEVDPSSYYHAVTLYEGNPSMSESEFASHLKLLGNPEAKVGLPKGEKEKLPPSWKKLGERLPEARKASLAPRVGTALEEIHNELAFSRDYGYSADDSHLKYCLFETIFRDGLAIRIQDVNNVPNVLFNPLYAQAFEPAVEMSELPLSVERFLTLLPEAAKSICPPFYLRKVNDLRTLYPEAMTSKSRMLLEARDVVSAASYPYRYLENVARPYRTKKGDWLCYQDIFLALERMLTWAKEPFADFGASLRVLRIQLTPYYANSDGWRGTSLTLKETRKIAQADFIPVLKRGTVFSFDDLYREHGGYYCLSKHYFSFFYEAAKKTKHAKSIGDLVYTNQKKEAFASIFTLEDEDFQWAYHKAKEETFFESFYQACVSYFRPKAYGKELSLEIQTENRFPEAEFFDTRKENSLYFSYDHDYYESIEGRIFPTTDASFYLREMPWVKPLSPEEKAKWDAVLQGMFPNEKEKERLADLFAKREDFKRRWWAYWRNGSLPKAGGMKTPTGETWWYMLFEDAAKEDAPASFRLLKDYLKQYPLSKEGKGLFQDALEELQDLEDDSSLSLEFLEGLVMDGTILTELQLKIMLKKEDTASLFPNKRKPRLSSPDNWLSD